MKYEILTIQDGIARTNYLFKTKKEAMGWLKLYMLALSAEGWSFTLHKL